ncbi:MAG TPA: hypothetical protein VFQ23_04790 [Anaerolineales bacterium]|nr:hypothetical protein [Anaerolineales bacterium]
MKFNARQLLNISLLLLFGFVLLRTAWVGDDAYITMRTVDNLLNGYGPTWNVGERLQTFTHPLWMFILTIVYAITRDAYISLLGLSLFVSLVVIWIFLKHTSEDTYSVFIGWVILLLSNASLDYSTSGLENPASHLLVLLFTLAYLKWNDQRSQNRILILALLAGLLTLNRMDLLLLCLPALLDLVVPVETGRRVRLLVLGFAPFILWELFSIIYYGFPFPNTYYAKLNTGISQYTLIKHGALFFFNSIVWDPITLITIGISFLLSMVVGDKPEKMISLGIGIYLAYVVWIGGDFMTGRFLSVPLLSAVILLVRSLTRFSFAQKTALLAVLILLGLMTDRPSFNAAPAQDLEFETFTGVGDEQAAYYPATGLLREGRVTNVPDHQWYYDGLALRDQNVNVYEGKGIGFLGFAAGPNVHVIDIFALSDPLLSHLPVQSKTEVLIGHFRRSVPDGYLETLETGRNEIKDPGIAEYYKKLLLITRGKIWSFERWQAIWKLNMGQYDDLLAPYINKLN